MKRLIPLFLVFISSLLISCTNFINANNRLDLSFSIGQSTSDSIIKTITENKNITENSKVKIECKLINNKTEYLDSQESEISLKDLNTIDFDFSNIPMGNTYELSLVISLNTIVLFEAESDLIRIDNTNLTPVISLTLMPVPGKITYNLNKGTFPNGNPKVTEYFVNSSVTPDTPEKPGSNFLGWYTTPEFGDEKITSLGKNIFVGDITLYAKWDDILPETVTFLPATTADSEITLNWTNPSNIDIKTAVITDSTGLKVADIDVTNQEGKNSSYTIKNLTNGKEYTYKIKIISAYNKEGSEAEQTQSLYVLTEKPVLLNTTTTVNGKQLKQVLFGDYPQTHVADVPGGAGNVKQIDMAGLKCFYGNDGYYYVENTTKQDRTGLFYNDKTPITTGDVSYFKIEPIKWRVLDENFTDAGASISKPTVTGKLLMAETVLTSSVFYDFGDPKDKNAQQIKREIGGKQIRANNYKHSEIRAFLNGISFVNKNNTTTSFAGKGFIDQAFTSVANSKYIQTITIDNSTESIGLTTPEDMNIVKDFACENTEDKIFLLSGKESFNANYGFLNNPTTSQVNDPAKVINPSDYAMSKNVISRDWAREGSWWFRSPDKYYTGGFATWAGVHGQTTGTPTGYTNIGVVPAIVISSNAF